MAFTSQIDQREQTIKQKLEILNRERISNAAYGITSLCRILAVVNRHNAGEVEIENEELLAVTNRYVSGGLEAAIIELSTTIQYLTEPDI
jgi:ABC-type transport system involved in cytochrome c biogenesis ATPase subunit